MYMWNAGGRIEDGLETKTRSKEPSSEAIAVVQRRE